MKITTNFEGGNVRVLSAEANCVRLECELRDTEGDWFYWAFRVQGAKGQRVTFDFSPKDWVGSFGAAVSHDLIHWAWGGVPSGDFTSFTYDFAADEDDVYFCHSLPYSTARFERFAGARELPVSALCMSEQGREAPVVVLGEGEETWLFTSRHHCCESTGTYVMEGVLSELSERPVPGVKVIAVPFVDLDGAVNGDQGKNRKPHDHNRDYIDHPIYSAVRAVRKLADTEPVAYMFDLHAPYHRSDLYPFEVRKNKAMRDVQIRFGELLERECAVDPLALKYVTGHDIDEGVSWNQGGTMSAASTGFFAHRAGMRLCLSMETPYFGTPEQPVTQENLVRYGRCLARAIRAAHAEGI